MHYHFNGQSNAILKRIYTNKTKLSTVITIVNYQIVIFSEDDSINQKPLLLLKNRTSEGKTAYMQNQTEVQSICKI